MEFEPEIEWRFLDELIGYHNNPKTHPDAQIEKIASSIHEFGFTVPLIVDASNVLVCGHGRLAAAKKLNLDKVPVIVRDDLSKTQIKQLRIAENKVSESGWDMEALKLELEELEELGADLELTGIDTSELDELLQRESGEHDESGADEDEVPDVDEARPRCKLGEIWQLGRHRLGCFDSTDVELVRRLLGDRKVDMIFSDPPYGMKVVKNNMVGADFGVAKKGNYAPIVGDEGIDTATKSFAFCFEVAPSAVQIWWGANYYANVLPPSSCWIVWDKRCDSGIENTFADCELAWVSVKSQSRIYRQLWNGMIRQGEHETRVHPTQKPRSLFVWAASKYGNPGDIVFDPFVGSGISFLGCEELNDDRTVFGVELSPHYVEITIRRWESFSGQQAQLVSSV